jgi:hypothetical protein
MYIEDFLGGISEREERGRKLRGEDGGSTLHIHI